MIKTYSEWVDIVNNLAYDEVLVDMLSDWRADGSRLTARIAELWAEIETRDKRVAELEAELKITDELLKEATETIGAVVACCTYNSNDDAKIGIYGIDQKAFTRIDQFIAHYNDAISAGKVSVDVKPVKRENDYQNDNRTNTGG